MRFSFRSVKKRDNALNRQRSGCGKKGAVVRIAFLHIIGCCQMNQGTLHMTHQCYFEGSEALIAVSSRWALFLFSSERAFWAGGASRA